MTKKLIFKKVKNKNNLQIKMKSILCLTTVCLFAFASAAAVDTFSNTDSGYMGTISVPQVFLVHKFPAKLKIYIINPRAKITVRLKQTFTTINS